LLLGEWQSVEANVAPNCQDDSSVLILNSKKRIYRQEFQSPETENEQKTSKNKVISAAPHLLNPISISID